MSIEGSNCSTLPSTSTITVSAAGIDEKKSPLAPTTTIVAAGIENVASPTQLPEAAKAALPVKGDKTSIDASIWDSAATRVKPQFAEALVGRVNEMKQKHAASNVAHQIAVKLSETNENIARAIEYGVTLLPSDYTEEDIAELASGSYTTSLDPNDYQSVDYLLTEILNHPDQKVAAKALNNFFTLYSRNLAEANASDSVLD